METNIICKNRIYCGFSQKQIANALGISCTVYAQKESGSSEFNLGECLILIDMLNIKPENLFNFTSQKTSQKIF